MVSFRGVVVPSMARVVRAVLDFGGTGRFGLIQQSRPTGLMSSPLTPILASYQLEVARSCWHPAAPDSTVGGIAAADGEPLHYTACAPTKMIAGR